MDICMWALTAMKSPVLSLNVYAKNGTAFAYSGFHACSV